LLFTPDELSSKAAVLMPGQFVMKWQSARQRAAAARPHTVGFAMLRCESYIPANAVWWFWPAIHYI